MKMLRVGIIGHGSISKALIRLFTNLHGDAVQIVGVLVRRGSPASGEDGLRVHHTLDALLAERPGLIAECAGQSAVDGYGERVLLEGCDLLVASVGALADATLQSRLEAAAAKGHARIHVPAGAVGGLDALRAMRLSGLKSVRYRARKAAAAWKGSPADAVCDLESLSEARAVFRGDAREAALRFPKNSNVAATIALAGLGFDSTEVELIADPHCTENVHEIEAHGVAGSFRIALTGHPSPENPRTSMLTSCSIAATVLELAGAEAIRI